MISIACNEKLVQLIDKLEILQNDDFAAYDATRYENLDYCCRRMQQICDKLEELQ